MTGVSSLQGSVPTSAYVYRVDGLRVGKTVGINQFQIGGGSNAVTTTYRYDGQMGYEDVEYDASGVNQKTTNYAIGPRGMDAMTVWTSQGSQVMYPIYDAHGNMIETLARSGTNYYSEANQRSFDAWGVVRQGAATGDPKGRYCADLGHKQDDESGLVYMRARYYEPTSGRFTSEDPALEGRNWFSYAHNNPVSERDESGRSPLSSFVWAIVGGLGFAGGFTEIFGIARIMASTCGRLILLTGMVTLALYAIGTDIGDRKPGDVGDRTTEFASLVTAAMISAGMLAVINQVALTPPSLAENAICGIAAYTLVIGGYLAIDAIQDAGAALGGG